MPKRRAGSFGVLMGRVARKSAISAAIAAVTLLLGGSGYLYLRQPDSDRNLRDVLAEEKGLYHKAIQGLPDDFQSVRRDGSMPDVIGVEVARVSRVVDGDTIEVELDGAKAKVRLLMVNTPESVHPDKKQNIPMGKTASDYTRSRLEGTQIRLVAEPDHEATDKYGRRLAYVFLDGENFNVELVRKGLSPYYTEYGTSREYDADFRSAEREARDSSRGIWADPELAQVYLNRKARWGRKSSEVAAHSQ